MTRIKLYENTPFTFDNNLLLAPPADLAAVSFSRYIKSALESMESLQSKYGNRFEVAGNLNGNETEIYLTYNLNVALDPGEVGEVAQLVSNALGALQTCNLLRADYIIIAPPIGDSGTGEKTAYTYFYNIRSVDTIAPYEKYIDEIGGSDPQKYAKAYAENITFRLNVTRNKLFEAYYNGLFDQGSGAKLRLIGGQIIQAGREILLNSFRDDLNKNAYAEEEPKGVDGSINPTKKEIYENLENYYYIFCTGVAAPDQEHFSTTRTAVYSYVTTEGDPPTYTITGARKVPKEYIINGAAFTSLTDARTIKTYLRTSGQTAKNEFTPTGVYILPSAFFEKSGFDPGTVVYDIENGQSYSFATIGAVSAGTFRTNKIYQIAEAGQAVTVGTNRTRVKLSNFLANETDGGATPIGAESVRNIYAECRISSDGIFKVVLCVDGEETDITDDFAIPLSPSNMSKSEMQAANTGRIASFIQQGGGIVTGVAAIAAGFATGGAALVPAVAAGVGSLAGSVGGLSQNIANGAPKNTATQNGATMGILNALTYGGIYTETTNAGNRSTIRQKVARWGYKCTYAADGFNVIAKVGINTADKKALYLKTDGAYIARSDTRGQDVAEIVETKLNGGALICYGVPALKKETGTE